MLIHPVFVVFISIFTQYFEFSVRVEHANCRVRDTVEHVRLHRRIMDHILEDHLLAHLQLMVKLPVFHKVAAQAAVPAQTIDKIRIFRF